MLIVLAVGVYRVESGATDPGDVVTVAYLLTIVSFPIRSIGWLLGEFPRSVVGYRRVKSVLDATGEMQFGDLEAPRDGFGARLLVDGLAYSYDPDRCCWTMSPSRWSPDAPSPSGRPPPARARRRP